MHNPLHSLPRTWSSFFLRRLSPPAMLLAASGSVHAVAGGAGGGFDSGSDGVGLIIELIFWILWSLPFPFNIMALAVLGGFLWFGGKRVRATSGLNRIPSITKATSQSFSLPAEFIGRNPGFDPRAIA